MNGWDQDRAVPVNPRCCASLERRIESLTLWKAALNSRRMRGTRVRRESEYIGVSNYTLPGERDALLNSTMMGCWAGTPSFISVITDVHCTNPSVWGWTYYLFSVCGSIKAESWHWAQQNVQWFTNLLLHESRPIQPWMHTCTEPHTYTPTMRHLQLVIFSPSRSIGAP